MVPCSISNQVLICSLCLLSPSQWLLDVSGKNTEQLTCTITVDGKSFSLGSRLPVRVDIRNDDSTDIQVAMPQSGEGEYEAFLLTRGGIEYGARIPAKSTLVRTEATNQAASATYESLKPGQSASFQFFVDTSATGQTGGSSSISPGDYELQIEFWYSPQTLITGGHYRFATDSAEQIEKKKRSGQVIIEPGKLWKGRVRSNLESVTLTKSRTGSRLGQR